MLRGPHLVANLITLLERSNPSTKTFDMFLSIIRDLEKSTRTLVFSKHDRKRVSLCLALFNSIRKSTSIPPSHTIYSSLQNLVSFWLNNFGKISILEFSIKQFYSHFSTRDLEQLIRSIVVLAVGLLERNPQAKNQQLQSILQKLFLREDDMLREIFAKPFQIIDVDQFQNSEGGSYKVYLDSC